MMQENDNLKINVIQLEPSKLQLVAIIASSHDMGSLESFFNNLPMCDNMAFVVIQNIWNLEKVSIPQIHSENNIFSVFIAENNMELQECGIYLIASNTDVYLENNRLHINNIINKSSTINSFLSSFAKEYQNNSIAIVLSGEGIDGQVGLKSIKEAAGVIMVQDPEKSKFNSMPISTIASGIVDYISPVDKLGLQLITYLNKSSLIISPLLNSSDNINLLDKIFILLRNKTGNDFSHYKKNTILRRVRRRMIINKINDLESYISYLQQNSYEVEILFKELLIGVTSFFRDPEAFEVLKNKIIPALLATKSVNEPLRIWISGCSTGEEAYSLAIILKECMAESKQNFNVQIFATDIDNEAIEAARLGIYPQNIANDISAERLNKYFVKKDDNYQVRKEVREMIIFALQNLIKDPPFSKLDLISCRNLLIYIESGLQKRVFPLFHYRLNKEGILFLGTSESIGEFTELFSTVDRKWKIFKKRNSSSYYKAAVDFSLSSLSHTKTQITESIVPENKKFSIREVTEKILLDRYSPSCVVINEKYDIIYFHGRTNKYLEPVTGEANLNVINMSRHGLKKQISIGIRKAINKKKEVICTNLKVKINDSGIYEKINLIVKPLTEPDSIRGLIMIIFEQIQELEETLNDKDILNLEKDQITHLTELEHELNYTREYLQTTIEELETSNEELKSTNEELQSSNEELQSTNEELETSKEELQAVNEELITLNSELQLKIDELSEANNDMYNLLASTNIGTIFLDTKLSIKRFTPPLTKVFNLIFSDIGRPITHISSNLLYDNLISDVEEVLETLIPKEINLKTTNNKYYRMRIIPYRTTENVIDGTVITFIDITDNIYTEIKLNQLKIIVDQSPVMTMITNSKGNIEYINNKLCKFTGYHSDELIGKNASIFKSVDTSEETFKQLWNTINSGREWSGNFQNQKKNGDLYLEHCSVYPITDENNFVSHFIAYKELISDK